MTVCPTKCLKVKFHSKTSVKVQHCHIIQYTYIVGAGFRLCVVHYIVFRPENSISTFSKHLFLLKINYMALCAPHNRAWVTHKPLPIFSISILRHDFFLPSFSPLAQLAWLTRSRSHSLLALLTKNGIFTPEIKTYAYVQTSRVGPNVFTM